LRRIAEAAESCGAYVLVDQVYRELTDQAVAATLHPRILTTAGFNKCWGAPGLRIGWLIAQPDVLGRVHEANRLLGLAPPRAGQVGALMMLEHEARCRKQLEERLAHNHATFRRWAEARGADAAARGLVRFVALGPDLEARAAQRGLLLLPGRVFGTPGPYRIGFGGEPARFAAALEALASLRGAPRV
jgi:aspartate/methionine/tyrosine aminotransferase